MYKSLIISHRGNLNGPNPEMENNPDYILKAIYEGFHAEIDVWSIDNKLFLGHDSPQYEISLEFLEKNIFNLWCHAKDIKSLDRLLNIKNINCFFHDQDDCTLTSKGYIWTYPNSSLYISDQSIAVMPERVNNWYIHDAFGICTDYAANAASGAFFIK